MLRRRRRRRGGVRKVEQKKADKSSEAKKMDKRLSTDDENESAADDLGIVLGRIDRRLIAMGYADRAASIKAGLSADGIRSMRKQWRAGIQKYASNRSIGLLAPVLKTTPIWLARGEGPEHVEPPQRAEYPVEVVRGEVKTVGNDNEATASAALSVTAAVATGIWVDVNKVQPAPVAIPVSRDARYLHEPQTVYVVQDSDVGGIDAKQGDFVIAVDVGAPRPGDYVIVYRVRNGLREITIRMVTRAGNVLELHGDGDDGEIIKIANGAKRADDGSEIKFAGNIIAVYRPL